MKKLSLLIFALLIISPIYSQWQTFNVTSGGRLYDVCVVNPNLIWSCGDTAKVYRTTNGGSSWLLSNMGLTGEIILEVTAIDHNRAWIHTSNRIFATTNGGTSWSEQFLSLSSFINKIQFFNANTGYILADQTDSVAGFFITRNGGLNWIRSSNAPVIGTVPVRWVNDNGASSLDSNFIWFVAKGSPSLFSRFYKLTGGLNNVWQYFDIGISPGQYSYAAFKDSNTGLVTFSNGISITTNGGVNWQVRDNTSFPDVTRELMIVPGTDWVVQTAIGNVRISYDLCTTWQPIRNYNYLNFCDAKDTQSIWAAGNNGQLLKYNFGFIGINQLSTEIPEKFSVHQNYPNPFNPSTKIKFEMPGSGNVSFKVFDILGRLIYEIHEFKSAGIYEVSFDAANYSSGIYYYKIDSGGFSETKKMILLK